MKTPIEEAVKKLEDKWSQSGNWDLAVGGESFSEELKSVLLNCHRKILEQLHNEYNRISRARNEMKIDDIEFIRQVENMFQQQLKELDN